MDRRPLYKRMKWENITVLLIIVFMLTIILNNRFTIRDMGTKVVSLYDELSGKHKELSDNFKDVVHMNDTSYKNLDKKISELGQQQLNEIYARLEMIENELRKVEGITSRSITKDDLCSVFIAAAATGGYKDYREVKISKNKEEIDGYLKTPGHVFIGEIQTVCLDR